MTFQLRSVNFEDVSQLTFGSKVYVPVGYTVEIYEMKGSHGFHRSLEKAKEYGLIVYEVGKTEAFNRPFGMVITILSGQVYVLVMPKTD